GDRGAGEHALESIGGHPAEHDRQSRAGDGLQRIRQQLQAVQKQGEAGGEQPYHRDEVQISCRRHVSFNPSSPRCDRPPRYRASVARRVCSSFSLAALTFGYVRLSVSTATTTAAATTRRVNHLLSAGTTNQGAFFEAVARIASSYARM